jgi:hypothetical protein
MRFMLGQPPAAGPMPDGDDLRLAVEPTDCGFQIPSKSGLGRASGHTDGERHGC